MKKTVLNRLAIIPLAIFCVWTALSVILICRYLSAWWRGTVGIGAVVLFAVLFSLVCPLAYSFDKDGLTVYYGLGIRKRVKWEAIKSISEAYGHRGWRHYRVEGFVSRFPVYRRGLLAKTEKTTQLLQAHWRGKIN